MSDTVLFVHGTGVREERFGKLFAEVKERLEAIGTTATAQPCYWAGPYGAGLPERSIPGYKKPGDVTAQEKADWDDQTRWAILEFDPLYELRLLGMRAPTAAPPAADHPGAVLRHELLAFTDSPTLVSLVAAAGLAAEWNEAFDDLMQSHELSQALIEAEAGAIRERQACARAWVALAEYRVNEKGDRLPTPAERQAVVDELVHALGADVAGLAADIFAKVSTLFVGGVALSMAPAATWLAARQRSAVADATSPFAGDVLLYQARGDKIRSYIANQITSADGAVTLLAHSLGGIACVDLLAAQELPKVSQLVTVGSQAPFLHELGALSSLEPGARLPEHFPRWVNVYDKKDLLSFVGSGVFGDAVQDIEVDNGCSFPRAHSAYWGNPHFWSVLKELLP